MIITKMGFFPHYVLDHFQPNYFIHLTNVSSVPNMCQVWTMYWSYIIEGEVIEKTDKFFSGFFSVTFSGFLRD